MEIIATMNGGVLISAKTEEINEIMNAVNGVKPESLKIGMKIPAIDYASTIRKIKTLPENRAIKNLFYEFDNVVKMFSGLKNAISETPIIED